MACSRTRQRPLPCALRPGKKATPDASPLHSPRPWAHAARMTPPRRQRASSRGSSPRRCAPAAAQAANRDAVVGMKGGRVRKEKRAAGQRKEGQRGKAASSNGPSSVKRPCSQLPHTCADFARVALLLVRRSLPITLDADLLDRRAVLRHRRWRKLSRRWSWRPLAWAGEKAQQ